MKTLLKLTGVLCLGVLSATSSAAKLDMQPGLWEFATTITSASGEMEKAMQQAKEQLAALPPEQRKMIEDMMAAQGIGISHKGTETLIKSCVTQEQINEGKLPEQEDCSQEILEQSKNVYKIKFACGGETPSSGTGEIVFSNPKNYIGKSTFTTQMNGKKEDMKIDQKGTITSLTDFQTDSNSNRIAAQFYPIHIGEIGGVWGRILVFISGLIPITLFITGLKLYLLKTKR